jgi:glycosyltransferase involved in cell wall biosynthesis
VVFEHPDGGRGSSRRSLRIGIATAGRFHVLDLARELTAFGHQVLLYSMLPDGHSERFGLARRYHRSLLPFVAPLVVWQRFAPRTLPDWHSWAFVRALDLVVTHMLEPCDVFICMSGIYVGAARHASRDYGAQIWLERGSRHILSQAEILAAVPGARRPSADIIIRELEGYRLADRIVVPSRHVAESFARDADATAKLFVNPYGTSLEMFPYRHREHRSEGLLQLVYAGTWSRRKGCDVLEQAVRRCDEVLLQHVGNIGDQPFPRGDTRFVHRHAVPQSELVSIYHSSDVFIHASREEGLSVVLAQALASGLPIIGTDRTGSEDLAHTPRLRSRIKTVPHDDPEALREAIEALRKFRNDDRVLPALDESDRARLSWTAYAKRYEDELLASTAERATTVAPRAGTGV